jgi:hypothetical protein
MALDWGRGVRGMCRLLIPMQQEALPWANNPARIQFKVYNTWTVQKWESSLAVDPNSSLFFLFCLLFISYSLLLIVYLIRIWPVVAETCKLSKVK